MQLALVTSAAKKNNLQLVVDVGDVFAGVVVLVVHAAGLVVEHPDAHVTISFAEAVHQASKPP
jgi:hypothetical protein